MRKIIFVLAVLLCSGLFAEDLKGQIFPFNEKANEEIIITNHTFWREAFKIYVHTKNASAFHFNGFAANYTSTEEGWQFLAKTPEIKNMEKWKSPNDFEVL